MRKIKILLLCLLLIITSTIIVSGAEGNMDGDGGETGQAGSGNGWDGLDGVRITVIEKKTRRAVGNSFDWTNYTPPAGTYSFAKRNKIQYLNGNGLAPIFKDYNYQKPNVPLPTVITSSGGSNIAALKSYFTDRRIVELVAKDAKISYDKLTNGEFTVIIEPISYFKYNHSYYAMTATEAALYDRQVNRALAKNMGFLTHQNQPLSMYLESTELGIPAGGGGSGVLPNDTILARFGIGTINFDEPLGGEIPVTPPVEEFYDYEYHADTDVVTSILVTTSSEINPDNPGRARFGLPTGSVTKEYVIPEDDSQLVWVKWHTPEEAGVLTIPVNIFGGSTDKATIKVKIVALEEDAPPNPEGRDRNDGFSLKSHPNEVRESSNTWGEWWAVWHPNWVWYPEDCSSDGGTDVPDSRISPFRSGGLFNFMNPSMAIGGGSRGSRSSCGEWVDEGWWDFNWRAYQASVSVDITMVPDERVPTANGNTIKSGYGVNAEVKINMTTNGGSDNTAEAQYVIAIFPEFDYDTYNRFLMPENDITAYNATWNFKPNEYSQTENPVHFTPIWYPDGMSYPVSFTVYDAWTPEGQMMFVLTCDDITINGNVYQDWHIAPGFGNK